MSDLNSLMSIAPNTGAFFMGQNQAQHREKQELQKQELQALIAAKIMESQQSAQMNPLLMEKQQLANQGLRAGLGGITAESQLKQLQLGSAQQTQPSDIASIIAKNKGSVRDEGAKDISHFTTVLSGASARLSQTPPALRMQALGEELQRGGADQASAQSIMQQLSRLDPNMIPQVLDTMVTKMGEMKAKSGPAYHQAMDVAKVGAAERRYATDSQAKTARYNTDAVTNRAATSAAGKNKQMDFWSSFYTKNNNPASKYAALNAEAVKVGKDTPEGQIMAMMAESMRPQVEAYLNKLPAGGADLKALGIETNAPLDIRPRPPATGSQTKSGVKYKIYEQ